MERAGRNLNLGPAKYEPENTRKQCAHLSPNGARVPLAAQTPSTQAPFLPTTSSMKRSSSWSYSIFAWRRDTLFRAPRSTSTWVLSRAEEVASEGFGLQRLPIVTDRVRT